MMMMTQNNNNNILRCRAVVLMRVSKNIEATKKVK
jgi:hypothetical protein